MKALVGMTSSSVLLPACSPGLTSCLILANLPTHLERFDIHTVRGHTHFHILRQSIVDDSPRATLMKFVRQPGPGLENRQRRNEQEEHANHDQRGEDDGLEDGEKDSGTMLRGNPDDCFR